MIWRSIDWFWIIILGVCCSLIGALGAYEKATLEEVPIQEFQTFMVLLKQDAKPQERMDLRQKITFLPGVVQARWLSPEEVLDRVFREKATEAKMLKKQMPQVVELMVPTRVILDEEFNESILESHKAVDRYFWDETSVAMCREERYRWQLRTSKIELGLMIGSIVVVIMSFLLASHRNQMRLMSAHTASLLGLELGFSGQRLYGGSTQIWLKAIVLQALLAVALAAGFFLMLSDIATRLDSAPPVTLVSRADWSFLWAAGTVAAIGKGLDLLRVSLSFNRFTAGMIGPKEKSE
jgi:hypothetical protein